jgi:filamentous hemagglutinin family protein
MERITRCLKGRNLRKGVSCLLMWFLIISMWGPVVMALESGNVISSDGIIGTPTWGDDTIIDTDHGAIIKWNNFDTSSTQSVTFNQYKSGELSDLSAVLNRISSGAIPTQFSGALNANGRVFIVNPAGIVFGAGSQIDVTQLVASGLNMEDGAFQAVLDDPANNKMEFSGGNGDILSRATIQADSVYLIGTRVFNLGPILAPNGLVVMAAGEEVRLYEDGSDVSVVVSDVGDGFPDVRNSNIVSATNGKIVLAAGDTFSRAVTNVGILAASGGEISIQAAQINNNGIIRVSGSGDGGSVNLMGTELVSVGVDGLGTAGSIEANAGDNGNGGTINIQTDGLFRVGEDSTITASGGSVSGNGGTVSVTCDDFEIAGEISASPGNKTYETGKLEITTPGVIIADGANAAATDTLYEEDIEALSQSGTSLIVNAAESIVVQDITDTVGDGEITGQFGDIQLLADKENADSFVYFEDKNDTIRTTLGDIIISAGGGLKADDAGGTEGMAIDVGNLTTGKDLTDEKPTPGMIFLTSGTTNVSGNITTGSLTVRGGWGTGKIDVKSSGNLTVNGDVIIGSESDILNVADEKAAEALVTLRADKDVKLNGIVEAHANGVEEDASVTKAYINIIAGDNANINGDLFAEATSSSSGTADAIVSVESVGDIFFAEGVDAHAKANTTEVQGIVSDEEPENPDPSVDHAQIIINNSAIILFDDIGIFSTPKSGADVVLDVLANDTLEEGSTIVDPPLLDNPEEGTLTIGTVGDKTVLLYNPPEDLSVLTFDENGEAVVTFTYTVDGRTANGDITLTNGLPVAVDDLATTIQNKSINIDVLLNDTDPDQGDILSVIEGAIKTKNGTLVMNEDGTFTYTPNDGFLGTDSFTYAVTDGFNESAEVVVKITVNDIPKNIPPTPGLDRIEWINVEVSGYPALANWVAKELGVDAKTLEIQVASSPASTTGIQPYESYSKLFKAAKILQDADGTHIAALAQVVNEFASSTAPPTEEQIIAIADAIARNRDEDSHYAVADEYLEALTTYVGILTDEMGFSPTESVQLVTDKYVSRLAQGQNVGVAAFIAASLAALGG